MLSSNGELGGEASGDDDKEVLIESEGLTWTRGKYPAEESCGDDEKAVLMEDNDTPVESVELPLRRTHPASFNISEVDLDSAWALLSAADKMDAAISSVHCVTALDMCGSGALLEMLMMCILLVN
mmetsp:Transcript_19034/g.41237  ORF Transcript_19034/g.41237 Transcript_19034/m.41237 type:complete len:125 (+) Transcript_19034:4128-4502(+)